MMSTDEVEQFGSSNEANSTSLNEFMANSSMMLTLLAARVRVASIQNEQLVHESRDGFVISFELLPQMALLGILEVA